MAEYVNNADFLAAIKEYKITVAEAAAAGREKPIIPNYLGDCILKIATHLSYKPNFINYSYKDEMILDGIENCIRYFDNFDSDKYSNPFAYFTQIIYFAFIRRISKEKKHSYIKSKLIHDMSIDAFELQGHDEDGTFHNAYLEFMQANSTFDDSFATNKKKEAANKKKKQSSLDDFIGDNDDELPQTDDLQPR